MSEILLPSLGAEMDEGTLLEWYVKPGDHIAYGDVIALLDTEKAEIEMDAFESGTIESLLIEPGQTVSVGDPIATLSKDTPESKDIPKSKSAPARDADTQRPTVAPPPPSPPLPEVESRHAVRAPESAPVPAPPRSEPPHGDRVRPPVEPETPPRPTPREPTHLRATPLARRIAAERGIDLSRVSGSGPGGAIVEADLSGAESQPSRPVETARSSRRREIIAAAMSRSKREIPHYYLATSIEIRTASDWLAAQNLSIAASERIVLSALLMKSVACAAMRFPEMNGHWLEDGFQPSDTVHLGMVVSLRTGGIVVPTFRSVERTPLPDLMRELRDVVGRARAGRLRSSELGDATLTLTSLGDDGAETIFGVIYPPQVAIVGFGGIHQALRTEDGLLGTQPVIRASLSADHRASDGQRGSQFLAAIAASLRNPEQL